MIIKVTTKRNGKEEFLVWKTSASMQDNDDPAHMRLEATYPPDQVIMLPETPGIAGLKSLIILNYGEEITEIWAENRDGDWDHLVKIDGEGDIQVEVRPIKED